ncbi:hypothetical protein McanCB56680_007383 [Microsporum canis]
MLLYIFEGASYPVVEISLNTEFPKLPAMTETLVSIPYTAANLPGPLPTKSQIESAPVLSQRGDTKIVKVDDKYAVKYGPAAQFFFFEGQNTIFVRESTNVSVPKIYALYKPMPKAK